TQRLKPMPTLFLPEQSNAWRVREPDSFPVTLTADPLQITPWQGTGRGQRRLPSIHRAAPTAGPGEFSLLVPRGCTVRVNQTPVVAGLRVLRHRDAIRIGRAPAFYFSTERLARVETFPGSDVTTHCSRCRSEILAGDAVVQCPICKTTMHEMPDKKRGCWHFSATCVCGGPTDFSADYRWHPGDL
ncbi:MAG: hypothetical protein V3U27_03045, partial [Candidatus Tectomicrobia bacterium]